jgi:TonB family protein
MKIYLLALISLIGSIACGQTKEVKGYANGGIEKYFVLKSDGKTKEGEYKLVGGGTNALPMAEGYYHNDLKDSVWKYYSEGSLVSEGRYKSGMKVGIWTGYTRGYERLKYDFDKEEMLTYIPALLDTIQVFKTVAPAVSGSVLERRPIYLNGTQTIAAFLMRKIRYPAMAREAGKQGEVIVSFIINENGNATDYKIENKLGNGIDEEVLNVFKQLPGDWVPGRLNNKTVAVQCEIPLVFEINKPRDAPHQPNQIVISVFGVLVVR